MEQESFKYYAFISYSHKDKKTAKRLQRRLERYHLPSAIQKTYPDLPKSLRPVFIDDSDLVANGTLRTALEANLERSNYLIVVCSPCSAKSEYVNDEVEYFIRRGRADRIIPLIIDGTPHAENPSEECFPSALLSLPRESEILGIDLKKFGERDAFLMVIASMLRLDLDSFVSREAKERKRRAMIFTPIAAALVIVAGILVWNNIRLSSFFSDNSANAQFTIAFAYYCKQDYGQAMEWFKKAAEQGYANAQYSIGIMYRRGEGVEQDYSQAMDWFRKAAEQGHVDAQVLVNNYTEDFEVSYSDSTSSNSSCSFFFCSSNFEEICLYVSTDIISSSLSIYVFSLFFSILVISIFNLLIFSNKVVP